VEVFLSAGREAATDGKVWLEEKLDLLGLLFFFELKVRLKGTEVCWFAKGFADGSGHRVDGGLRWEGGFDGEENGERRCFREGGIGDFDVGDGEGVDFLGRFLCEFCGREDVVVGGC